MKLKEKIKKNIYDNRPALYAVLRFVNRLVIYILSSISLAKTLLWEKRVIARERSKVHHISGKKPVKITFIVIHLSTWKASKLYELLSEDDCFNPSVLIVPDMLRPPEIADAEAQACADYFSYKRMTYFTASRNKSQNKKILEKINPDIVIFNNPHGLTLKQLHIDLSEKCLACYIPYHVEVCRYNNDQDQYNRPFHNVMWKVFAPHRSSLETYKRVSRRKGRNVTVTGYTGIEDLVSQRGERESDPWKSLGLKRIIWAPHHTIDSPNLPYANFLRYAECFRELVELYADRVQWCFKPHPLLKPKLLLNSDWGPERTEEYYSFWEQHSNTQIELGKYEGLFRHSDAMIHDSGSFLAEYLYVDKPVMYLWSSPGVVNFFNEFGLQALDACERGNTDADIHRFIRSVIFGEDLCSERRKSFLQKHSVSIGSELPSDRILNEIKSGIWQ